MDAQALLEAIIAWEPEAKPREKSNLPAVTVPLAKLTAVLRRLREDGAYAFDFLMSHTAIDWMAEARFEVVYILFSTVHGHQIMVTANVDRNEPVVPTVCDIWAIAEYQEREVYDMFGIQYDGHPDLRRVFLEDDWVGFPLRKDYQDEYMLERPQS